MRLSIVSTLYRSAPHLREFHARATAAARAFAGADYEIVLVNDGSPDDSLALALGLQANDPHLRVIDLSKNFGHHQAMWVGLSHAAGDDVFLIDCDLEESPEWLELFAEQRRAQDADVAFGVQDGRAGGALSRAGGWLFYKVFNALCDDPIPINLMTVRLMSRPYVDALLQHHEVTFAIAGLWARTGFKQTAVTVVKKARRRPSYNLMRRLHMFVHAVTSFSNKPLVFSFYVGAALLALSAAVAVFLVAYELLVGGLMAGWPSLMVSVYAIGGLILFFQGVQGVYLSKIYLETKRRPVAIVRQEYAAEARREQHARPAA